MNSNIIANITRYDQAIRDSHRQFQLMIFKNYITYISNSYQAKKCIILQQSGNKLIGYQYLIPIVSNIVIFYKFIYFRRAQVTPSVLSP